MAAGCAGCALASGPVTYDSSRRPTADRGRCTIAAVGHFDRLAFEQALAEPDRSEQPLPGVRVLIVPHHWLAADLIVAGFRVLASSSPTGAPVRSASAELAEGSGWRRIILLSPDHNQRARAPAVTTACDWLTPYGLLGADSQAIDRLVGGVAVARDDATVAHEHGLGGLVPAVARLLPGSTLVPLVVRNDGRWSDVVRLAESIVALWTPDSALIVSTDFSHDVLPGEARRRDRRMIDLLDALRPQEVRRIRSEGCDAWNAVAVAQLVAGAIGARDFTLLERRDGSDYRGYAGGPVTSYVAGVYRLGERWP